MHEGQVGRTLYADSLILWIAYMLNSLHLLSSSHLCLYRSLRTTPGGSSTLTLCSRPWVTCCVSGTEPERPSACRTLDHHAKYDCGRHLLRHVRGSTPQPSSQSLDSSRRQYQEKVSAASLVSFTWLLCCRYSRVILICITTMLRWTCMWWYNILTA